MAEAKTNKLSAKISKGMKEINTIPKTGENTNQKYKYATDQMVLLHVREFMSREKLAVYPSVKDSKITPVLTKSGGTIYITEIQMEFEVIDSESGESFTRPWRAQGQDTGDKGIYKAITSGEKYFLLKLFLIPTGDDVEVDRAPAQQQPPRATVKTNAGNRNLANEYLAKLIISFDACLTLQTLEDFFLMLDPSWQAVKEVREKYQEIYTKLQKE